MATGSGMRTTQGPYRRVAVHHVQAEERQHRAGGEHQPEDGLAEHHVPHFAAGLVRVDVHVQQLIFIHHVGSTEEQNAEGHQQRRDARVHHHDYPHN